MPHSGNNRDQYNAPIGETERQAAVNPAVFRSHAQEASPLSTQLESFPNERAAAVLLCRAIDDVFSCKAQIDESNVTGALANHLRTDQILCFVSFPIQISNLRNNL